MTRQKIFRSQAEYGASFRWRFPDFASTHYTEKNGYGQVIAIGPRLHSCPQDNTPTAASPNAQTTFIYSTTSGSDVLLRVRTYDVPNTQYIDTTIATLTALDTSTYTATATLYGRAMFTATTPVPDPFSTGTINGLTDAIELSNGRYIGRGFIAACSQNLGGFGGMNGYAFMPDGSIQLPFSVASFRAVQIPTTTPYTQPDFCAEYPSLEWLRPCMFIMVPDFTTLTTIHVYYRAADGALYSGTLTATGTRPTYENSGGATLDYALPGTSYNDVYDVDASAVFDYAPANPEYIRYWYWRGTDGNPYWYKLPAGIIS